MAPVCMPRHLSGFLCYFSSFLLPLIYESQTLPSLLPVKPQMFYLRNKPEIFLHYWLNTYHSFFSLRSAQKDREQRAASWYTSVPTWNPPDRLNTVLLHPCCHLSLLAPPVIVWSHTEVAWIRETFRDVSTSMLRMALLKHQISKQYFCLKLPLYLFRPALHISDGNLASSHSLPGSLAKVEG